MSFLLIFLFFIYGCAESSVSQEEDRPQAESFEPGEMPKISLSQEQYHPEDRLFIEVNNLGKTKLQYFNLRLDGKTTTGEWKQVRGDLLCPCVTRCEQSFVLLPGEKQEHILENFYEENGTSLPHTVFCGLMKTGEFRIGVVGHPEIEATIFYWNGS